jgi:hypothetical protein
MAKQFDAIDDQVRAFIEKQHIFFTGSAAPTGRVNVSPKGMDALRVLGPNRVAYLDLTGSGNETSAHLAASPEHRLTIMFCAFEGAPLILRLYGHGTVHRLGTKEYEALLPHFTEIMGARQIVELEIEMVQTSCGYAVPFMDYREDRPNLVRWAENKGEDGLEAYRREKNMQSIDGFATGWGREAAE